MKRILPMFATVLLIVAAVTMSPGTVLANAICTFTITDINFGNIDLVADVPYTVTGTLTATCSDGGVDKYITICPSIGAGSAGAGSGGTERYMSNGSDQLVYNIYQDAAMSQVWGSMDWAFAPEPPTWLVWKSSFSVMASRTIYARIPSGQTSLPNGMYSSMFSGGFRARIEYKEGEETCDTIHNSADGTELVSFQVSANTTGGCTVSATTLDFGNAGALTGNVDSTNTVSVTCPNGTSYTVGLDGGLSGAADPTQRKMSLASNEVTYGLYRDAARTLPWGDTVGVNTASGTGTGSQQGFTAYGRVPAQTTPQPGTYTDTIVVTITY